MSSKKIYIIVATDKNNGIGKDGTLPWHFSKDMDLFMNTTMETIEFGKKNMVIMGRKTWESIPEKFRPLQNRLNAIITRNSNYQAKDALICGSLGEAIRKAELNEEVESIFIIGGSEIYEMAIDIANGIYKTEIDAEYECDTFFPDHKSQYVLQDKLGGEDEKGVHFEFNFYDRSLALSEDY